MQSKFNASFINFIWYLLSKILASYIISWVYKWLVLLVLISQNNVISKKSFIVANWLMPHHFQHPVGLSFIPKWWTISRSHTISSICGFPSTCYNNTSQHCICRKSSMSIHALSNYSPMECYKMHPSLLKKAHSIIGSIFTNQSWFSYCLLGCQLDFKPRGQPI